MVEIDLKIGELAKHFSTIYLDNCIMNMDFNPAEYFPENNPSHILRPCLAEKIGAAGSFSDVRLPDLYRYHKYATELLELISTNQKITMCPEVIKEYGALCKHFKESYQYLRRRSTAAKGKKSEIYERIIHTNERTYALLNGRTDNNTKLTDCISDYLLQEKLHISSDSLFQKRTRVPGKYPSKGDCNLVSHALAKMLVTDAEIGIITEDADIVNLVRNFNQRMRSGKLPSPLSETYSTSYSPLYAFRTSAVSWRDDFRIVVMTKIDENNPQQVFTEIIGEKSSSLEQACLGR